MKKCPKCQHENSDQAKFCNSCGSKLSNTCSKCGMDNNLEAKFCSHCGFSLATDEERERSEGSITRKRTKKEAERRQLTILFCDLVGSTPLSEQLDPEEYRQVITDYHRLAEKVIRGNNGHIAQYLGDGLLTYFGYPQGLEDAPRAGVKTGLGILEAIADANKDWVAAGKTEVSVRIGIHTGLVVVDEHLALGEAVNIAARLEGLAPHNGIVISPQTNRLVYGWFEVKSIGKHTLKGISEPMELYQVLHESGAITRLDVAKNKGLSPLVGRRNELDILIEYWEQAKKGNSNFILLHGEAGIGKSRLVDTMEEKIALDPSSNLAVARGSAYQQNSAFFPIVGMLEQYIFQFTAGDKPDDKLVKLEKYLKGSSLDFDSAMPLFAEFLSIPSKQHPPLIISPFSKRQKTMDSLTQLLLYQAELKHLLLVLEDLHWADASTLEWLNLFIEKLEGKTLLTLCTTRPGFKAEWQGRSYFTQINLQRLSSAEIMDICHHQTKGKALPEEILNQIASKTEGVPLFVEELTKTIIESEVLVEKTDGFEVAGPVSTLAIPSTLQDSLLARLDRLDEVKEIVQVGSVLGREFSIDMLTAVLPDEVDNLEHSMLKLLDSEIFYLGGSEEQTMYQFKHALIQDAAYESLLKSRRQQMHQKVASVLKDQFKEIANTQPELLAHHYTEAGQPLKALPLWLQAGQLAISKNAGKEAVAHLEKGLGLLHKIESEKDRFNTEFDFLLVLGTAYVSSLGYPHPKVKETFNRAKDLAYSLEINQKLSIPLFYLMVYYFNTEEYSTWYEMVELMNELAKKDKKNRYSFDICVTYQSGATNTVLGNFKEAEKYLRQAIGIYDPSQTEFERSIDASHKVTAESWLSIALHVLGYIDQAENISINQLKMVEDYTGSHNLYHLYTFPAMRALFAKDWKKAERILESYLPIVRDFGDPVFTLTAEVYYYLALAYQGDLKAFDKAIELINVCFNIGFKAFASTLSPFIAEGYFQIGDNKSAENWIEKILEHVNRTGSHGCTAELYRLKGIVIEAQGKFDDIAEEYLAKALDLAKKQSAKTYELRAACDLARLWVKQGKIDEAYELLKGVYDWFTEGHDSVDLRAAKAILDELTK